jgi:hypothetical protein
LGPPCGSRARVFRPAAGPAAEKGQETGRRESPARRQARAWGRTGGRQNEKPQNEIPHAAYQQPAFNSRVRASKLNRFSEELLAAILNGSLFFARGFGSVVISFTKNFFYKIFLAKFFLQNFFLQNFF